MFRDFFATLFRSTLSLIGAALTTLSAVSFLTVFALSELKPGFGGGYLGLFTFLVLPVFFVLGLVLMPVGIARARRAGAYARAPVLDFNVPRVRAMTAVVSLFTLANIGIVSTATYKGVETMESVEFCGTTCHSVMTPEYSAHQRSPHAQVKCTQCHVGSGAQAFVAGKANGVGQLVAMVEGTVPRPITAPVENFNARNCEACHARERLTRDRLVVIDRFAEDETNTRKHTVLLDKTNAIHWHVGQPLRFRTDGKRRFVSELELGLPDGGLRRWTNLSTSDAGVADHWRTMDCLDCHNRATHVFQRPRDEVDRALASGALDATLPFVRREALRVLTLPWTSADDARTGISRELNTFYASRSITPARLEVTTAALVDVWSRNVFPEMKVSWGTYPDFRDHDDEGGCFRCHTGDLVTDAGTRVSGKCELCHVTLAEDEEAPEILDTLRGE